MNCTHLRRLTGMHNVHLFFSFVNGGNISVSIKKSCRKISASAKMVFFFMLYAGKESFSKVIATSCETGSRYQLCTMCADC